MEKIFSGCAQGSCTTRFNERRESFMDISIRVRGSVVLSVVMLLPSFGYAAKVYNVHTDHLGTPQVLTDENHTIVWSAVYQPFGEAVVNEDPDGDGELVAFNLRFPGQYYDKTTGAEYNYYRDYDASLGRYIQSDPVGIASGLNTYGYVDANPVNAFDPFGLVKWTGTISVKKVGLSAKRLGITLYESIILRLKSECVDGVELFVIYRVGGINSTGASTGLGFAYTGSVEAEDGTDTPSVSAGIGAFSVQLGGVGRHSGTISSGKISGKTSGLSPSLGAYGATGLVRASERDLVGELLHVRKKQCNCSNY